MINHYHKYNKVRVKGLFYLDGVLTDPTTISVKVLDPTGTETTYTYPGGLSKSGTGSYYKEISSNEDGEYHYLWLGTGTVEAADENYYIIDHSKFS